VKNSSKGVSATGSSADSQGATGIILALSCVRSRGHSFHSQAADASDQLRDIGGHRVAATKKYRDVQANGWAAIVIDDLESIDPWTPRILEIRGRAEAIPAGGAHLGPGFSEGD
jgi:hypothetical protein